MGSQLKKTMKNYNLSEEAKALLILFTPTMVSICVILFIATMGCDIEPAHVTIHAKNKKPDCVREGYVDAPFTAEQVLNRNSGTQKVAFGYIVVDGIKIDAELLVIGRSDQKLKLSQQQTIVVTAHYWTKPSARGYGVYFNEVVPKDDLFIDRYE